jgi:hypothetical protein
MDFTRTQSDAETLQGETALAAEGEKVGTVDKVLYDKATGKAEWFAVETGLFGLKSRLAPVTRSERRAEGVFLPYAKSQIEAAPELEGDEISQELERRLASHYGLQYSEGRSPTGLAQGQKSEPQAQKAGRTRQPSKQASRGRKQTSRTSRRAEGPTREELYAEAKRLQIEGRSKMNKAQLQRAVGQQGSRPASKGRANPFEVQKFLEAVGYPASKRELVREAKEQGADTRVRSTLEQLPDEQFDTPAQVSEAIAQL